MIKIFDAHNDLISANITLNEKEKYLLNNKDNKIFCAYFSYNNDKKTSINYVKKQKEWLDKFDNTIFSVENCWFLNENNLDEFLKLKPFCATLTHNQNNDLCGGSLDDGDLTLWGKEVVNEFDANDIYVDVAHMNQKSFYTFLKLNSKPIFCSHTGFYSLYNHKRNLSDYQITEIIKSRGFIGMAMYPKFFTIQNYGINDIVSNILYFWENWGIDTLGFGTDFWGIDCYPVGINDYIDLQKIALKLKDKGAKSADIEKLFCKNLENFINKKGHNL